MSSENEAARKINEVTPEKVEKAAKEGNKVAQKIVKAMAKQDKKGKGRR